MLAIPAPTPHESSTDLAAHLAEIDGGYTADPSYALIVRILKEDRPITPEADLEALISTLGQEECDMGDVTIRVRRNASGGAGFAFDPKSLKITSLLKDRSPPLMKLGDIIVAVNGSPVTNLTQYNSLARGIPDFRVSLRRTSSTVVLPNIRPTAKVVQPNIRPTVKTKPKPKRAPRAFSNAEWQAMSLDIDNMSYEELLALEEQQGSVVKPGICDEEIACFPLEHVCGGGDECSICLEDFCDGEELMRFPCMHKFHSGCCRDWLRRHARCPVCNLDLKL